jgi:hypothetical protein
MCPTCGEGSCHSPLLQSVSAVEESSAAAAGQTHVKKVFYLHHKNYAEMRGSRSSCFLFCGDDH